MYSLIVGAVDGTLAAERMLEVVDDDLENFIGSRHSFNLGRLLSLPTLLTPEIGDTTAEQMAQVGRVSGLSRTGRFYYFYFTPDPVVPPIPTENLRDAARALRIGDWDLSRTRWSVKAGDLYQAVISEHLINSPSPSVFKLPSSRPKTRHVAAMMPFNAAFNPVWDAIRAAAVAAGWTCRRADDIWDDSVVLNDIVSLIVQSEVVICDVTGRNANVFYEAGIAHTLGREVILITQAEQDVPFDLSHFRYVKYLPNTEGLSELQSALLRRLRIIVSK